MLYELKENNPFYGKAGSVISQKVYDRLPSKHQLLFKEHIKNSNNFKQTITDREKFYDMLNKVRLNMKIDDNIYPVHNNEDEDEIDENGYIPW